MAGTRISLDGVICAFKKGASPESILEAFPRIGSLEEVHGAIAFYLDNKEAVEAYLRDQERLWQDVADRQPALPESLAEKLRQARDKAVPR